MRAVVVAGSDLSGGLDPDLLAANDLLVAVDAGGEALAQAGLVPALLVGDMDSVSASTREMFERQGTRLVSLPRQKDETDLEAALRIVIERGAGEVDVYGALGGPRLDHLLGNVLLLASPSLARAKVRLVDDRHEMYLVRGEVRVEGDPGDLVSLIPLSERVEDVSTEGLLYPLAGETLGRSSTRGVSNELTAAQARVTHGAGDLLLVHYRGR